MKNFKDYLNDQLNEEDTSDLTKFHNWFFKKYGTMQTHGRAEAEAAWYAAKKIYQNK